MVGQTHDVLALFFYLIDKLQVLKLRNELSRRFEEYSREESRVKIAISKFGRNPKEMWEGSRDISCMRRNLQEAFEGVAEIEVYD